MPTACWWSAILWLVQPDVCVIVDALEDQGVDIVPCGGCECCAVPPVLLPKIARSGEIFGEVEIVVDAGIFEGLQDRRGHVGDFVPTRRVEGWLGDRGIVACYVSGGGQLPGLLELEEAGVGGRVG